MAIVMTFFRMNIMWLLLFPFDKADVLLTNQSATTFDILVTAYAESRTCVTRNNGSYNVII